MLNYLKKFRLPLHPTILLTNRFVLDKCKPLDSAKCPLWLVLLDTCDEPYYLIFKSGDDIRQDLLTLQMLNIMDQMWKKENLDFNLTIYRCLATSDSVGMIEVVLEAETIANIQKTVGVTGAFKTKILTDWLREHNPTEDDFQLAVNNFTTSCAGYCVATYILGVGDRHNDSIMLKKSGHLFHIDFGHFLGNFKKFIMIKREKVPFVFIPEFAHIIGGEKSQNFQRFVDLCSQAYLIVRKHSSVFINLFAMMLTTGIPELKSASDLQYLREVFKIEETEDDAADSFKKLIFESLNDTRRRLDYAIHLIAHRKAV